MIMRSIALKIGARISCMLGRNKGRRIVAFHEIDNGKVFRERLELLQEDWDIVDLHTLMDSPAEPNERLLALTFDDGYQNWVDQALPVLLELNLPAVFFVCSGIVGLEKSSAERFVRHRLRRTQCLQTLTHSGFLELAKYPLLEIGGHTRDHYDLGGNLRDKDIEEQIFSDRIQLQNWSGREVKWFAYPFGGTKNCSLISQKVVASAGYEAAFTIQSKRVLPSQNLFFVGRDALSPDTPMDEWKNRLAGGRELYG